MKRASSHLFPVTGWMILSLTGLIWECRVSLSQDRDYHSNISGEECDTIKVMFTNILYKQTMYLLLFNVYFLLILILSFLFLFPAT